jgi:anti-sigma factor RsiW
VNCQEFVELVTEYFEDTLPPDQRAGFEQHLALCDGCTRYLEQLRATAKTLGRVEMEQLSPEARNKLLAAFDNWRQTLK